MQLRALARSPASVGRACRGARRPPESTPRRRAASSSHKNAFRCAPVVARQSKHMLHGMPKLQRRCISPPPPPPPSSTRPYEICVRLSPALQRLAMLPSACVRACAARHRPPPGAAETAAAALEKARPSRGVLHLALNACAICSAGSRYVLGVPEALKPVLLRDDRHFK